MQITPIQICALRFFAAQNGRFWKSRLRNMWWKGTDDQNVNGYLLRQIRNELGPVWLEKFVLDGRKSTFAENQEQAKSIVLTVSEDLGALLTPWEQKAAKEWQYTTLTLGEITFRIGVSTGGVISTNGVPHTPDLKGIVRNNHLFELAVRNKLLAMQGS